MKETTSYFYPNKMGRIILLSFEEVMGKKSLVSALHLAELPSLAKDYPPDNLDHGFSFSDLSQIQTVLEDVYGPRGGKGLSLRAGRVAFKYGLKEFGPLIGVTDLDFRLSTLENKLRAGADVFAEIFNRFSDQRVRVDDNRDYVYWHIERCPICWNRQSDIPVCYLAVGLLEETAYWFSGGKTFKVEEISCIAKGDPTCTIQIDKQALD